MNTLLPIPLTEVHSIAWMDSELNTTLKTPPLVDIYIEIASIKTRVPGSGIQITNLLEPPSGSYYCSEWRYVGAGVASEPDAHLSVRTRLDVGHKVEEAYFEDQSVVGQMGQVPGATDGQTRYAIFFTA